MSSHTKTKVPETEENLLEKISENENESESESESESEISDNIEDTSSFVDDEDLNLDDIEELDISDDDDPFIDMGGLLSSVLATEEGETVCSALVNISRQLEMQNKIMIKILTQLQK